MREHGWRRERLRGHPAKPRIGVRAERPDEMWLIDTTTLRLVDGSKAYVHAVIDSFSRRVLAWRVARTFETSNTIMILLDASRVRARSSGDVERVVIADRGVENVNDKTGRRLDLDSCAGCSR